MPRTERTVAVVAACLSFAAAQAQDGCPPGWMGFADAEGSGAQVRALTPAVESGSPVLYVGGKFTSIDGLAVGNIAMFRQETQTWSTLGGGVDSIVQDVLIAGPGPDAMVYVCGHFGNAGGAPASRVARWDPATQTWSALGQGLTNIVGSLALYDDGSGDALYAAGHFSATGAGDPADGLARWDGATWSEFGGGVDPGTSVSALAVWDDGAGAALYVGGGFTSLGGLNGLTGLARWDGETWSAVGPPFVAPPLGGSPGVGVLLAVEDAFGNGPALFAAGNFQHDGASVLNHVAVWSGQSWSPLGTGLQAPGASVMALSDDLVGPGPALFVGGSFVGAGGTSAVGIARWDGASWSDPGPAGGSVMSLASFPRHDGLPALVAGGEFEEFGGAAAMNVALRSPAVEAPRIVASPESVSAAAGAAAVFDVGVESLIPVSYQWRRNGEPLADGGPVAGAGTAALLIDPVGPADHLSVFDCVVSTACGGEVSAPAALGVESGASCGLDANGDGVVDGADLAMLLGAWGTDGCALP